MTQKKLKKDFYEAELLRLQLELVKLQYTVVRKGLKLVVLFEGRDAAGKGGVIKRIVQCLNPRVARIVALPKPTPVQKEQWFFQRYVEQLPSAGQIALFDRSWYNRAGVEKVMGFCSDEEYREFLRAAPEFERMIQNAGIFLAKYWLDIDADAQARRLRARASDPLKRWKLSPMDVEARRRWHRYTDARDAMFSATNTVHAPWYAVDANDKRRARLTIIRHLLSLIPYEDALPETIEIPDIQQTDHWSPEKDLLKDTINGFYKE